MNIIERNEIAFMTFIFFEAVTCAHVVFADQDTLSTSVVVAAETEQATEETVNISTTLVDSKELILKEGTAKEQKKEEAGKQQMEKKAETQQKAVAASQKKSRIARTVKNMDGEVSWVSAKSLMLHYRDPAGDRGFDSIFPFEKKLALIGYNSIMDIHPGDMVRVQYDEAVENSNLLDEDALSLKSIKLIQKGGAGS